MPDAREMFDVGKQMQKEIAGVLQQMQNRVETSANALRDILPLAVGPTHDELTNAVQVLKLEADRLRSIYNQLAPLAFKDD